MSTVQMSLLQGDELAQHRFTLQALLSEDLAAIAQWGRHEPAAGAWELQALLDAVRVIAGELRALGPELHEVPF